MLIYPEKLAIQSPSFSCVYVWYAVAMGSLYVLLAYFIIDTATPFDQYG